MQDNVHSREISLHDLNILHDGSDFAGPLRLLLRASVPRFIIRYYALQEQLQRLNVVAETGEGEHDEGLSCFFVVLSDSLQLFYQNFVNSMTQVKSKAEFLNKRRQPTTTPHTPRLFPKVRRPYLSQTLKNRSENLFVLQNRLKKLHKRIMNQRTRPLFKTLRPNIAMLRGRQHMLLRMRMTTRVPVPAPSNLPISKI